MPTLRRIAYVLGSGIALFPIHWAAQPFIQYIFLPQIGLALIMASLIMYFSATDHHRHKITFGSKAIWIPMLVIVVSMVLQLALYRDKASAAVALFGLSLFGAYLIAHDVTLSGAQDALKKPLLIVLAVAVTGGIVVGVTAPGSANGGIITNYCAATGFLVIVGLLVSRKWLWITVAPILVSVFLIGALEGVFVLAVLAIIVLARKDWSRKIWLPVGVALLLIIVWTASGKTLVTYNNALRNIGALEAIRTEQAAEKYGSLDEAVDVSLSGRWSVINKALHNIKVLGNGYVLTANPSLDRKRPVHNVPLMVMDQIGPLAALAWLWLCIFCLVKTRQKYLWAAILATSIFDYYVWTQFAPFVWVFAGMGSVDNTNTDLIFKTVNNG